jgi:hypothetical protein
MVPIIKSVYAIVENLSYRVSVIYIDGEPGLSAKFTSFTNKIGIILRTSVLYLHDTNGTAERLGGVLMTIARLLLQQSGLLYNLFPELYRVAAYLLNRTPKKRLM